MNIRKLNEELDNLLDDTESKFPVGVTINKSSNKLKENNQDLSGEADEFTFIEEPETIAYADLNTGFTTDTSVGQIESGEWLIFENGHREEDDPMGSTRYEAIEEWVNIVGGDFADANEFFEFFNVEDEDLAEALNQYFQEEIKDD